MPQRWLSRLATVRQLVISTLALALGAAAALALVSCGGGEDAKLLPGNTAAEITENLDRVKQYAEEGECVGAEDAVGEVNAQVEGLTGVDPKLVEALQRGAERLSEVVAGCTEEETETVAPADEATTEETETVPPGLEKKVVVAPMSGTLAAGQTAAISVTVQGPGKPRVHLRFTPGGAIVTVLIS